MWDKIKSLVRKWLGINLPEERQPIEQFTREYEDVRGEMVTSTIANKLSMLTFADSSMQVKGSGGADALSARAHEQYVLAYPELRAAEGGGAWTQGPVIV